MAMSTVPAAVHTIWIIMLVLTVVIFVPLSVYLLHRTWHAARSIQRYAAEALVATRGIAGNTAQLPALDTTITVATEMLQAAGAVEAKLATVAGVLEQRSA